MIISIFLIYLPLFFCSHALVYVEIKNEGEDAFKPEVYGDVIILERRISVSTSSIFLKDHQGLYHLLMLCFLRYLNTLT